MKGSNSGKHEEELRWALIKYKICLKTPKPSFNYLNYDITLVWIVNWGHWEVMWHAYYLSDLHIWICLVWRDLHVHIALTNHRFLLILLISRICLHKKMIVSAWLQTQRGLAIRGKFQHRPLQVTKLNPEENFNLFVNNLEAIREGFKNVDTLKRHQIVVVFFPRFTNRRGRGSCWKNSYQWTADTADPLKCCYMYHAWMDDKCTVNNILAIVTIKTVTLWVIPD